MITISLPKGDKAIYASAGDYLVGPFSPDGTATQDIISYQSAYDSLGQGVSRYHEKSVDHVKIEGTVNYNPFNSAISNYRPDGYPNGKQVSGYVPGTYVQRTVRGALGLVQDGYYGFRISRDGTYRQHDICVGNQFNFSVYEIVVESYNPSAPVRINKTDYKFVSLIAGGYVRFKYSPYKQVTAYTTPSGTWYAQRNFADAINLCSKFTYPDWGSANQDQMSTEVQATLNMTNVRNRVDSIVRTLVNDVSFPLEDTHYGELASEASQKVNANPVNMIAFLRDLRDPKSMMLKLKNLHQLKTHANNHLAVNYGILPTIDDIKHIIEAFKRIRPYIDKNGYNTYNAVRTKAQDGAISFRLEQRIKIAIEDEDDGFKKLLNSVESSGFALTLENVWDLIPYSFVLDWFIDIGDFLERCDSRMRLSRYNVRYSTMSRKRFRTMNITSSPEFPATGSITVVEYQRWTVDHCPLPPLSLASEPTVSSHWLEAGALLVQRAK